jgi:hypothetical protein
VALEPLYRTYRELAAPAPQVDWRAVRTA